MFLKYGPPNTIVDRPYEEDVLPYQVWHYYKLGTFTNKKFVFYEPDIVTNEYLMLHSDVQGEVSNNSWQYYLQRKKEKPFIVDPILKFEGKSGDDFNNPR